MESYNSGSAVPTLNRNFVHPIIVPYTPDVNRQHCIVSHLDSLSAKVRELEEVERKTLAECDALKQAMLREVFE